MQPSTDPECVLCGFVWAQHHVLWGWSCSQLQASTATLTPGVAALTSASVFLPLRRYPCQCDRIPMAGSLHTEVYFSIWLLMASHGPCSCHRDCPFVVWLLLVAERGLDGAGRFCILSLVRLASGTRGHSRGTGALSSYRAFQIWGRGDWWQLL